ncbi:MAG TPA: DUF2283 domain-containing protein [Blastocatellia bacterium]|nr:DUF2283 domain-containing protein [Blastocatellia bacterium]
MKDRYLEVTFRKGKPIAAYLYLPRDPGEKSQRTEKVSNGILIDYGKAGQPIGIEITAPDNVSLTVLNDVLAKLKVRPVEASELAPLLAA